MMEPSASVSSQTSPTPSCLRSFLIESPPDVRLMARRLRDIQLLCDVTLLFNEDEVEGGNYEDEDDAEEKAAPLHGMILIRIRYINKHHLTFLAKDKRPVIAIFTRFASSPQHTAKLFSLSSRILSNPFLPSALQQPTNSF